MVITDPSRLRVKCRKVPTRSHGGALVRKLTEVLLRHNKRAARDEASDRVLKGFARPRQLGVGLAAPQIGLHYQAAVLLIDGAVTALVNPEVTDACSVRVKTEEGCLSLPGQTFVTWRCPWVLVATGTDRHPVLLGRKDPDQWTRKGLLPAIAAQHEMAHLHGLMPVDFCQDDYPYFSAWPLWVPWDEEKNENASQVGGPQRPGEREKTNPSGPEPKGLMELARRERGGL